MKDAEAWAAGYAVKLEREAKVTQVCLQGGLPNGARSHVFSAYIKTGEGFDAALRRYSAMKKRSQAPTHPAQQQPTQRQAVPAAAMLPESQKAMQNWLAGPMPVGWIPEFGKQKNGNPLCVYPGCVQAHAKVCTLGICGIHRQHCKDPKCRKHGKATHAQQQPPPRQHGKATHAQQPPNRPVYGIPVHPPPPPPTHGQQHSRPAYWMPVPPPPPYWMPPPYGAMPPPGRWG